MKPSPVGRIATGLNAIAAAPVGIPHWPAACTTSGTPLTSGDVVRVSSRRHGEIVK